MWTVTRTATLAPLVAATIILMALGNQHLPGATYWVTTTGKDSNSGTSESAAWATLKYACSRVAADQGHTIRLGSGTFSDPGRLSSTNTPAILPRGVSLIGAGRTTTIYRGQINVPLVANQVIADFRLDGSENMLASTTYFTGLMIETGSGLEVRNLRIDGFHSMGLQFGIYDGLRGSVLRNCELINNGKHNERGFGMRTGNLTDCRIHDNLFREERGKGGEVWNSGNRSFTNVQVYGNTFATHNDSAAGWNGQQPFNFEWWNVDCLNVEVYGNTFDGSISLIDPPSPRANKTPFSVRIRNNTWMFTKRYAIEAGMRYLQIDNNYIHFGTSSDPDVGGGYGGIVNFGESGRGHALIHHNVFDNVPLYCIHNLDGDHVRICNNTALGGRSGQVPSHWQGDKPRFMTVGKNLNRAGWQIINNVFDCDPARPGNFMVLESSTPTPTAATIRSNVVNQATSGMSSALLGQSTVEQVVTASPRFLASGSRPDPYFRLAWDSPLIDAGVVVTGVTGTHTGTAPDIGAYELTVPTAPGSLAAKVVSSSRIDLSWQDRSSNEAGFRIERKTGSSGSWAQVASVAANVQTYASTGLSASTQYFFRVRAYNKAGNSSYSNEVSAATAGATAMAVQPIRVNFQPSGAPTVAGYLVDSGSVFGTRGNGWSYGWNAGNDTTRDRNAANALDQLHDTLIHLQSGGSFIWEIALPNGIYSVRLVAGDPSNYNSDYRIAVEGAVIVAGVPSSSQRWVDGVGVVTVADGRLTVANASGSVNNKLCFIEIMPNLVANQGFEQGLTAWGDTWVQGSVTTSTSARSGQASLRLGGGAGIGQGILTRLRPNTTYVLSAWGKRSGSQWAGVGVTLRNGSTTVLERSVSFSSSSWAQKSLVFTTPAAFTYADLWAWNDPGGEAFIDDVLLFEDFSAPHADG